MNRVLAVVSVLFLLAALVAPHAAAQMVRHSGGDGNLVIVAELGVVIGPQQDSDNLEVLTLLPDAAGKSDVTIEKGDLLLMIDGTRVRELAALREAYDGAEVGRTVKIGFRRGDERFLVMTKNDRRHFFTVREGGKQLQMLLSGMPEGVLDGTVPGGIGTADNGWWIQDGSLHLFQGGATRETM